MHSLDMASNLYHPLCYKNSTGYLVARPKE
jgi:hypothetical protein